MHSHYCKCEQKRIFADDIDIFLCLIYKYTLVCKCVYIVFFTYIHRGSLQKQSSPGLEYRINDVCKSHYFKKVYVLHDECLRFSYEKATRNKQHYLIMTLILFLAYR